jgi:TonB-dependent receptor
MKTLYKGARPRASVLSGVGLGALAVALATPALAAQSQAPASREEQVEEIVVTGVRASVASALEIRKTATQLQDSIVAEDIGKLPDNNVVEALQHVSGVSILRNNVEPNTVLIRGLPDIATTLNGRQIFTSAGRFISLPDLPAELLARVDVKKSTSASDIEGGIAGLIDVSLHRPFNFTDPQLAGGLKYSYGALSKKWSPMGSLLLSNRWDTGIGELGLLADVSYHKRQTSQDTISQVSQHLLRRTIPGLTATGPAGTSPGSAAVAPGQISTPTTTTFGQADTTIERSSLNVSGQWRPNDRMEFFGEVFYARLRNQAPNQVNVFLLGTCPNAAESKPFPGTNVVQVAVNGCYGLTSLQDRRTDEDTYQIATGGKWEVTDRLTMDGEFNYTHSKDRVYAIIIDGQYNYGSATNGVTLTYNPFGDGGVTAVQPAQQQLNPAVAYMNQLFDQNNRRSGDEYSFRLNGNYEIGEDSFIRSIEAGYRYYDRGAVSDANPPGATNCSNTAGDGSLAVNLYRLAGVTSQACTAYRAALTPTSVGGVSYASLGADAYSVTRGSFFGGKYGTDRWLTLKPGSLVTNPDRFRALFGYTGDQVPAPTNHFEVSEVSHAGFVKANYGFYLGDVPIDGNFGLRVVKTKLTEAGFSSQYVPLNPALPSTQGVNATCTTCLTYTPTVAVKNDTQYLPSFNMRARLREGLFLRAAYSKTVTRPTFAQLNPGQTVSAANATLLATANSGNPDLNPVKSTNYDLYLSYYWGCANRLTAAAFYR